MSLPPPLHMALNGPRSLSGLQQFAVRIPSLSATGTVAVAFAMDGDQELASFAFVPDLVLAGDDTNYWTIALFNRGTDGSGTAAMFTAVDTRAASLNGLAVNDAEVFTLTAPVLADGEVAAMVFTKSDNPDPIAGTAFFTVKRRCTYK